MYCDDLEIVEKRMYPGGWSSEGFLAPNQKLEVIIKKDKETLSQLGVTTEQMASKLKLLIRKGENSDYLRPVRIDNFETEIYHVLGLTTCPYANEQFELCGFGNGVKYLSTVEFKILNIISGESIMGSSLMVHLIGDHNFFGGPGTKYRIEPRKIAIVLELIK